MSTLFGRPLWYSPPKLISYSLDGEDANKQIFDIYSFSHVSNGIIICFVLRFFHVKFTLGLCLTIIMCVLFELFENNTYFIQKYKKTYSKYDGDSIANIIGDLICGIIGFVFAFKYHRLSIVYIILVEILLYPYNASALKMSICRLVPVCN
jgi:hypothetical protein